MLPPAHWDLFRWKAVATSAAALSPSIDRVGPFVHSLSIYEWYRWPEYLPGPLVRAFVNKRERKPVLPSLHSLSLGPLEWELGNVGMRTWSCCEHSLNFLGLFLAPSVRRLALKCQSGSLDIEKIQQLAPSITDLRLWLDVHSRHQPTAAQNSDTWKHSTMLGLRSWGHLLTLSISSAFLNSTTASFVGAIPALQSLEIVCEGPRDWRLLQFEPDSFPSLRSLFVIGVFPHDIIHLLDQPNLMGHLTTLHLDVVDSARPSSTVQQYVTCVDSLCQHAPSLSQLTFRPSVLPDERVLQSLQLVHLTKLDMRSVSIPIDMAPLLLTFPHGLRYFDVSEFMAPAIFLEQLAVRYPTLHFLAIGVLVEESLKEQRVDTPIEGRIYLQCSIICLYERNEAEAHE